MGFKQALHVRAGQISEANDPGREASFLRLSCQPGGFAHRIGRVELRLHVNRSHDRESACIREVIGRLVVAADGLVVSDEVDDSRVGMDPYVVIVHVPEMVMGIRDGGDVVHGCLLRACR